MQDYYHISGVKWSINDLNHNLVITVIFSGTIIVQINSYIDKPTESSHLKTKTCPLLKMHLKYHINTFFCKYIKVRHY